MAYDALSSGKIEVDIDTDIHLLQLGFHSVAVASRLVQK